MTEVRRHVFRHRVAAALLCLLVSAASLPAQETHEEHLSLDGWIEDDGGAVHLTWRDADRAHRGSVEIARRPYGAVGGATWTPIEVIHQQGMRVTDSTTQIGQAYEYRVLRRGMDGQIVDVGYWLTGRDVPAQAARGVAHVVVDQSILEPVSDHLNRFIRDLTGDGWEVRSYRMLRHSDGNTLGNLEAVGTIKAQLQAAYTADPGARHAVVLVGHVPFALSGNGNPDGHAPAPHATDLIYGDVDGRWRMTSEGVLTENALPSDAIEMQVGRIDFASVSGGDTGYETHLLRAYFDKNHNWRHARLGDLRVAYGESPGLVGEIHGLRNIVGPQAITEGGHHDVGEAHPWLWGVDFGDHAGQIYAERYANKAVFAINFGSHKQRIDLPRNAMTALLAQSWYTVAVGWGARPTWRLHHMALGGSIGDVHMRTVNNGRAAEPYVDSMDYIPTGQYLWRNPVWVNLLGDPTLRAFPLAPSGPLVAETRAEGVHLSWAASRDQDVLGYEIYKMNSGGAFTRISGSEPVSGLEFSDSTGAQDAVYMVRALGRKDVHAGSFLTLSQGVFAQVGRTPLTASDLAFSAGGQEPFSLPLAFSVPQEGLILGFVEGPDRGQLKFEDGVWRYIAPPEFSGTVLLRFVVSDSLTSDEGTIAITVPD